MRNKLQKYVVGITYQVEGTQLKRIIFCYLFIAQVALGYGVQIFSYISYAQIFQRRHRLGLFYRHADDNKKSKLQRTQLV